MALYEINSLRQTYAGRTVLELEALSIQRGEVLALLGPSGAGKSTLLRLLNFVEAPSAGSLQFDGQAVPADPPLALVRRVTTVYQRPIMLNQTLRANVAYGLRVRGLPADGRVEEALARVGLTALADRPAHTRTISGGELQRAALARALVIEPEVLLLDEPTANLDPYNVSLIEAIVREQNRARGTTIVLVTHNVFQARRMATRAGLLLNGRLIESGPTAEFFERPRDPRTAAFVNGEMVY